MGDTFFRSPLRTAHGRFLVSLPPGGQLLVGTPDPGDHGSCVFFIQREKAGCWTRGSLELTATTEEELAIRWVTALQFWISHHGVTRPKSLLVFINPFGGCHKAVDIYRGQVASLFALAEIHTHVIETSRANEAREYILHQDLSIFDGLVSVGGDGTVNEVMHALIERTQRKAGVSEEDADAELLSPHLRIGIIPAGSTDCVCFATVGIADPVTSALHIIIGDSQPLDVCSLRHNGKLLRYSVSLAGYGFYGDVVSTSEKHRWMGPARYAYAGVKVVLSNRSYEGTVEFQEARLEEANPRDQTRCRSGCLVCSESSKHLLAGSEEATLSSSAGDPGGGWRRVQGRFLAVNVTAMSSACPKSPEGLSPCAHLADGTADLILVRKCSMLSFLRHLVRHTNCSDQFDLPFVSVHRVRAVRFTACKADDDTDGDPPEQAWKGLCGAKRREEPALSCWTCDGEALNHTDVSIRVHARLIHLFARGIERSNCTS
ncbi:ceramide kinase-like isoform X2 [Paroedura picta]|uniref:ceramide kinase-like isoform X2 n=1 Tax=Paroedura picta TaxID=143630 RepID=UPI0040566DC8